MRLPRPRLALKTLTLLSLATLSTLAAAQDDLPGRVGRIALTQGQVSIGNDGGGGMAPAQVNWPVTSGTMLSTARGARTELRIGSTSIRLDGDSSLEVMQLDDANLRLRLHYGSASVRVSNPEALAGFELDTPQAHLRLQQPARVRVDAERVRDTSAVEVFEGVALVDGGGSELTLRAGKAAELGEDDVRTLLAQRDAFDDWSLARDRAEDNAASARYVGTDMTGYEDLDRYGNWRDDSEYGPLWTPMVSANWVPYSDGSWTWLEPWGWTWVDNASWGYAPFHYGRWVFVNHRWSWAPGRHHERPVWAPALVGWVGGAGWNVTLRDHSRHPASGWYPLTPHDRFVPSYHASESHLHRINDDVRPDPRRPHDFRPQGLTVLPQERFAQRGRVDVAHAPRATPAMVQGGNVAATPAAAPSAPPPPPNRLPRDERFARAQERDHERDHERDQGGEHGLDTGRISRDGFIRQAPPVITSPPISGQPAVPLGVNSPTPHQPPQALGVTSPTPHQPPQAQGVISPAPHQMAQPPIATDPAAQPQPQPGWQRRERFEGERRERFDEQRRERFDEQRRERPAMQMQAPVAQPAQLAQPAPQASYEGRGERAHRGDWERPREAAAPQPAPAPAAVAPRAMAAPVMAAPPAPAQQAARPAAPAPQHNGGEQRAHGDQRGDQHGQHQQDR
jgi:hypothetical protein